jgi:hypothetical protein
MYSAMPTGPQMQLLSAFAAAGTVRRLWTGAEATNVNLIDDKAMLAMWGQAGGRNETNGCTGWKAWVLSATRLTRRYFFSLATTGNNGR